MKYYHEGVDNNEIEKYFDEANVLGEQVWGVATAYARTAPDTEKAAQLLPALNEMLDLASSRLAAHHGKVPDSILYFLFSSASEVRSSWVTKTKTQANGFASPASHSCSP